LLFVLTNYDNTEVKKLSDGFLIRFNSALNNYMIIGFNLK